ncbi:MAG: TldD/PmbA family protein [Tannerellaceae bacterium]|jgi:PmbA protein|nr:TldD/PmbA family protein [Tannerellaceae bacterium]
MITQEQKKLAQWALDFAIKNGCQSARVVLASGTNSSFEIREMKVDRLTQASESSLRIQLFVDGRYGSFSTNRLDKKELERFIRNGIESTRFLAEDKARTLPASDRYYKGGQPDLQQRDPAFESLQPDDKVKLAMSVCEEMMNKDPRTISPNSSFSDELINRYLIASNGLEAETSRTSFSLVASVSIKGDGDARPESYWYDSSLFFDTLIKTDIGTKALERTIKKLGQKKAASGKYRMVVDNLNSTRLISPLIRAIYGSSIQQKDSFLLNKLDQKVLGDNITLIDNPHQLKTIGARYFDGEGVATRKMPVFENGVLKTYYIDTYYANKLDAAPTVESPSILQLQLGTKNTDELIASVDKGVFVSGFNGGNSNSSTGDFSYGIEGFLIEKGKLTQPVNEMNITGNMLSLWNNLAEAGNDPRESSSWKIPSLLFNDVDFSGL